MWLILLAMIVIVALAGLVIVYAAYPHRGEKMPRMTWLGEAMERAVDAAPTLTPASRLQHHRGEDDLLFQEHHEVGGPGESSR